MLWKSFIGATNVTKLKSIHFIQYKILKYCYSIKVKTWKHTGINTLYQEEVLQTTCRLSQNRFQPLTVYYSTHGLSLDNLLFYLTPSTWQLVCMQHFSSNVPNLSYNTTNDKRFKLRKILVRRVQSYVLYKRSNVISCFTLISFLLG